MFSFYLRILVQQLSLRLRRREAYGLRPAFVRVQVLRNIDRAF